MTSKTTRFLPEAGVRLSWILPEHGGEHPYPWTAIGLPFTKSRHRAIYEALAASFDFLRQFSATGG
jgi:hypothetical protein